MQESRASRLPLLLILGACLSIAGFGIDRLCGEWGVGWAGRAFATTADEADQLLKWARPATPSPAVVPPPPTSSPTTAEAAQPSPQDLAQSRRTALVVAAERVAPAVVSIGAERPAYVRYPGLFDDSFFGPPAFYQKIRTKTPYIGSGIAMDKLGHIVTNYHVVEGAERLFVTLADGEQYEAKLVDYDEINDIAFLKIDAKNLRPAPLGDSDKVMLGEWALAIGNPYGGVLDDPSPTITAGVVSARNRYFRAAAGSSSRLYEDMIQTDASVNPGNSGGALANAAGEVIGVNTFIISESGGSIGIGFAIPINKVKRMMTEITRYGRLRRARVDFVPMTITPYIQRQLSLSSSQGVFVYRVEDGGPARDAGIQPGDVITQINGRVPANREEFLVHLFGAPVGAKLKLEVLREGKTFETQYSVQEEPEH